MWALGRASNGSSSALARTLAVSESGHPPPNRFVPHARQKVFALPSAGWNVCSSSLPSSIRIVLDGTRPFTVPMLPDSFLQLSQWQYLSVSKGSVTSNSTPPQRQLPRSAATAVSLAGAARTIVVISKGASIGWAVVLVLLTAAAYEAAIALEWISMGSEPGDDATGQAAVTIAAFLALLTGIVATVVSRRILHRWPAALVPIAAGAYMVAHYYSFDSYYLPSLRRFSDSGGVSSIWVYGVTVAAVIVALAIRRRPSVAPVLSPILLLICAGTVVAEGFGH